MNGKAIPDLSAPLAAPQFAHRLAVLVVFVGIAVLARMAWNGERDRPPVRALALTSAGLFVAQALLGAALIWTSLATGARVAHEAVGALVWAALVATTVLAYRFEPTGAGTRGRGAAPAADRGADRGRLRSGRGASRRTADPARRGRAGGTGRRVRRPDEAAHHHPAADHDGAADDPGAGRVAVRMADPGDALRRNARRGRRQRHQLLHRPRHRPGHAPDEPAAAPRPLGLAAGRARVRDRSVGDRVRLPVGHHESPGRVARGARRSCSTSSSTRCG